MQGSTQRPLATALALGSGGLTAAELLLVAAQSTSREIGAHRAPVRRVVRPSLWLYYTTDHRESQPRFSADLDATRLNNSINIKHV